eukprot:TRINITY_DN8361_c1_g1_i1.p1 TRINITY_DN8361_c1_g1~~TRINITY_DN8361_c1_g1_i1.p1  ORF type:complete len:909 (+),score=230.60 TRINITY_DN8361_c1_g1_i1:77-2803(+)
MASAALGGWRPKVRVLCLHGRCQTAEVFKQQLDRLVTKAATYAEFVFIDGPAELPLQHGERVNTRGWAADGETVWEAPAVLETLTAAWSTLGPFDGVLGFSEGCSAAHRFCRLAEAAEADGASAADPTFQGLRFAVFAGGPAPEASAASNPPLRLPSLHFASPGDTIVPIADSKRLAACFDSAEFCSHDGKHAVPQRVEEVKKIVDFLERMRRDAFAEQPLALELLLGDDEDPRVGAEQRDELETLAAMYSSEELSRSAPAWPVRLGVGLGLPGSGGGALAGASLRFSLPPGYPSDGGCVCDFFTDEPHLLAHKKDIMAAVEEAREPGSFSIMQMVQAAQQWAEDHEAAIAERGAPAGAAGAAAAEAEGDEEGDDDDVADRWWDMDEARLDEPLYVEAERRAKEFLPDSADGSASASWARASGAASYGRPWEFVVGLVGKPSVGKSTFFNSATRPDDKEKEAEMDPRPFTTIDPNVAPGWFAAPCPAERAGHGAAVQPEHGRAVGSRRRHPCLVKDVAGLVPGAYLGRGRGNTFLQDLCDADSLIHVVDASGRSDAEGVDLGKSSQPLDPLDEVGWVRRELHLWIFCNVCKKWESVRKKAKIPGAHQAREALAKRLFSLFTGYRATEQLITEVYEAAGFSLQNIVETVLNFKALDLHLLVACFLRVRFPIVVALNKVDQADPQAVSKVRAALGASCVPVSARAEWWLWQHQRQGHLTYQEGAGSASVTLLDSAPPQLADQLKQLKSKVFDTYGSTGVLEAISLCVMRRSPVFVCPVLDFATCEGLLRAPDAPGAASAPGGKDAAISAGVGSPLAAMVMLRPLCTVEEAFSVVRHEQMLRGDFVRGELLELAASRGAGGYNGGGTGAGGSAVRVLKKEDELKGRGPNGRVEASIIRFLTNKKAPWQPGR